MDYKEINRKSWNQRVDTHVTSDFYDNESFLAGRSSLNSIELEFLGDVRGKSILHLQCHFGQDTISLSRMGARTVGVDLSDKAIGKAQEMAGQIGADARFICCDIYELPEHLDEKFDIVFTSYGTIGWLPDLDRWAGVVEHFLKPGGQFLIVDFHPVVWMFDDNFTDVTYGYFNREPIVETNEGTYADTSADMELTSMSWNHELSEILSALLDKGLRISAVKEYDYSPYNCFRGTEEVEPGKYQIAKWKGKLPMVYAVEAFKP